MKPRAWNSTLPAPSKPLARKAALRSGSHLSRSEIRREAELRSRTPIKRRNAKRQAKRKAEGLVYGPYHAWIGTLPCTLASDPRHECRGKVEGHHLKRVGNGGVDAENEIPLCENGHTLSMLSVHVMGPQSFDRYWGVDSEAIAAALWERYGAEREEAA